VKALVAGDGPESLLELTEVEEPDCGRVVGEAAVGGGPAVGTPVVGFLGEGAWASAPRCWRTGSE
jgi:hypothetical protein